MYGNSDNFHLFLGTLPKNYTKKNACSMFYKQGNDFSIGFILIKTDKTINQRYAGPPLYLGRPSFLYPLNNLRRIDLCIFTTIKCLKGVDREL